MHIRDAYTLIKKEVRFVKYEKLTIGEWYQDDSNFKNYVLIDNCSYPIKNFLTEEQWRNTKINEILNNEDTTIY